ncbi:unnamed protein product [Clonostachys byssicola]|uniref:Uncharacterized protein n=1 Tax=Clonostachys byssicola TaxID=160290 RepID=A0A9N9U9X5_9HYPO|nr:unnamed protein product [Clonostachys byssicola]
MTISLHPHLAGPRQSISIQMNYRSGRGGRGGHGHGRNNYQNLAEGFGQFATLSALLHLWEERALCPGVLPQFHAQVPEFHAQQPGPSPATRTKPNSRSQTPSSDTPSSHMPRSLRSTTRKEPQFPQDQRPQFYQAQQTQFHQDQQSQFHQAKQLQFQTQQPRTAPAAIHAAALGARSSLRHP